MSDGMNPLLLLGRVLVERGIISEEVLEKVLEQQAGHRALKWPGKKLGEHLLIAKLVDRATLIRTLQEREAAAAETQWAALGELAVENGFMTREELHNALAWQRNEELDGRVPKRLGQLMRENQLLSEQALQAIIERQRALYRAMDYTPETVASPGAYPFAPGTAAAIEFGF